MASHIVLMNLAAPPIALLAGGRRASGHLAAATCLQLVLFLAWHSPAGMALSMQSQGALAVTQLTLLASAIWFWMAVLAGAERSPWWVSAALILTGKIVCLVAVLLVFSPRGLYPMMMVDPSDQHLAGLLMLVACPLTYIGAATMVMGRWLGHALSGADPHRPANASG